MKIELDSNEFGQKSIFDFGGLVENMQLKDLLTIQRIVSIELNRQLLMVEWMTNNGWTP
jgi:hypothetical protein